jgi:hypothetical protein
MDVDTDKITSFFGDIDKEKSNEAIFDVEIYVRSTIDEPPNGSLGRH